MMRRGREEGVGGSRGRERVRDSEGDGGGTYIEEE